MEKIKCPYCGAEFYHDYVTCPKCGKPLKENNKQPISKEVCNPNDDESLCESWLEKWKEKGHEGCWIALIAMFLIMVPILIMIIYSFNKYGADTISQIVIYLLLSFIIVGLIVFVCYETMHYEKVVKHVEGYTILAARYGDYIVLICNGKTLDSQKIYSNRYRTNLRTLKGKLPNGMNIWAEFAYKIEIHIGENKVL